LDAYVKPEGRLKLRQGMIGADVKLAAFIHQQAQALRAIGMPEDQIKDALPDLTLHKAVTDAYSHQKMVEDQLSRIKRQARTGESDNMGHKGMYTQWESRDNRDNKNP
jgi:hypothetical protein